MLRPLSISSILLIVLAAPATAADEQDLTNRSGGDRVIAIDVLLEPDATMVAKATAANARLRGDYPRGYKLDSEQVAHITLVHRYVRKKDMPAIEKAVSKVAAAAKPLDWQLTATGYEYAIWSGVAITSIRVAPTAALSRLQEQIVKAVQPFAVTGGTTAAFSTSKELPTVEQEIVKYVEQFVPNSSGKKYNPHVTVGVAREDFVKQLKAEPFAKFSFKPRVVAIYQLGGFGTAQKKLWEWKPN
jgi:2'-5' RNA ligase superfamily